MIGGKADALVAAREEAMSELTDHVGRGMGVGLGTT